MPPLTAECCFRLFTIRLMNRREDTDTCMYSMFWIAVCLCLCIYVCVCAWMCSFLPLDCTLSVLRSGEKLLETTTTNKKYIFHHLMSLALKNNQLFCFIPTVNNAFQFASIIHWISLAVLCVFFAEVSLYRPQHKHSLTYGWCSGLSINAVLCSMWGQEGTRTNTH